MCISIADSTSVLGNITLATNACAGVVCPTGQYCVQVASQGMCVKVKSSKSTKVWTPWPKGPDP